MKTHLYKRCYKISYNLLFILALILLLIIIFQLKEKKNKTNKKLKYIPKLPEYEEEHQIKKEYFKTYYDNKNIRYHFEDLYNNRKLYFINYDYYPYQQINRSISFDENAKNIYETTGMLNLTKLEFHYYGYKQETKNFNNIHLSMAFDNNYILLSSVSIASILQTASNDTYIHFHFVLNNCTYNDIKPIIYLKKINNRVSFIFYNGKQAEYDFNRGNKEWRGIGEYSRLLIPQIINNTNKVLILDSGDILANKDLSEIYFFELKNNYFAFTLEDIAGKYIYEVIFGRNNFYSNGGVTLINIRQFRKDNLYKKAFFTYIAYNYLPCPYQDILLYISNFKFAFFPLNYNCPQFYKSKQKFINNKYNSKEINKWIDDQKLSPFKYTKNELIDAALNPVIIHLYKAKPFKNLANKKFKNMWINYAKMTNLFEKIKEKYPKPFNL